MPDLRKLSADQRRTLAMQAKDLALNGMAAREVQAQLGISQRTYARWATRFGFRECDLNTAQYTAGTDLASAASVLRAVRNALEHDKQDEADRLLRAWKQAARRGRDLAALESEAAAEAAAQEAATEMSNEELSAFLTRHVGRAITVVD